METLHDITLISWWPVPILSSTHNYICIFFVFIFCGFFFYRQPTTGKRKKQAKKGVKTSKILVRNVPFEAQRKEIFELFK